MAGSVLDKGNQIPPGAAVGRWNKIVKYIADHLNNLNIFHLGVSAHIVRFAISTRIHDGPDGFAVVINIKPVSHVLSIPVNRQLLEIQGIENHERDQLLWKLIGPIIVRAI